MTQFEKDIAESTHDELKAKYKVACHLLGEEKKKVDKLMWLLKHALIGEPLPMSDNKYDEYSEIFWQGYKIKHQIDKY